MAGLEELLVTEGNLENIKRKRGIPVVEPTDKDVPTAKEFNALVDAFNDLVERLRNKKPI